MSTNRSTIRRLSRACEALRPGRPSRLRPVLPRTPLSLALPDPARRLLCGCGRVLSAAVGGFFAGLRRRRDRAVSQGIAPAGPSQRRSQKNKVKMQDLTGLSPEFFIPAG